jgi:lipopolysaccharide export system protein LptA
MSRSLRPVVMVMLSSLLVAGAGIVQEIVEQPGEKYEITARTVEVERTPEGRVTHFSGGVVIKHGTAVITAQSGRAVEGRDMAILEGGVRIVDRETEITANTGEYYRSLKKAHLSGDVDVQDGKQSVQADDVIYHRTTRVAQGMGSVSFKDMVNNITVEGGRGEYDFSEGHGTMSVSPVLTAPGEKQILMTGQTMDVFRKEGKALVTGDVRIYQGEWSASCDSLVYLSKEDEAELIGEPVITERGNVARAELVRLRFEARKLREAVLSPDAYAIYRVEEGEVNLVFGDEIVIRFEEGKASHIAVRGSARGTYYMNERGQ